MWFRAWDAWWWFRDCLQAAGIYANPKQRCVHCTCPYWTLTPWKDWHCNHPNCQEAKAYYPVGWT